MVTLSNNAEITTKFHERKVQRIKIFIILLVILGIPGLISSLLTFNQSPIPTLFVLLPFSYYVLYYKLTETKYANIATYVCFLIINISLTIGISVNLGALTSLSIFYILILIGIAMVLGETKSLDIMSSISLLIYAIFVLYHLLENQLLTLNPGDTITIVLLLACPVITLVGTWFILHIMLDETNTLQQQLIETNDTAQLRAAENEQLLNKVQESYELLNEMQDTLHATINQLSLPMIRIGRNIALLPLIGYLDEQRSQVIINKMLEDTDKYRINIVVLELTGLQMIDEGAISLLQQAIQGLQLLGAQAYISGINSQIADKFVHEGKYLINTPIVANLAEALEHIVLRQSSTS